LFATVIDYAVRKASSGSGFSFQRLNDTLNNPLIRDGMSMMEMLQRQGVVTKPQTRQLQEIVEEAAMIEMAMEGRAAIDISETPDGVYDLAARYVGARAGAAAAEGSAGGASLVMAGAGSRFSRKIFEKVPASRASAVLLEAIENPRYAAALMRRHRTKVDAIKTQRRLEAWLIQAGITAPGDLQETKEEKRDFSLPVMP
jgi:hypothetical protein